MNNKIVFEHKDGIDHKMIFDDEKRILNELKKMGGYGPTSNNYLTAF